MVQLAKYTAELQSETAKWIVDFFGFHSSLVNAKADATEDEIKRAVAIIDEWQTGDSALYTVRLDDVPVGFLRIGYRGPIVAWIEDIYIDPEYRGRGIATEAIGKAEDIVKSTPGYQAVCFDVVTRNAEAISLYHKLGYTDLSIITLRKEFEQSKRDRRVKLFDKDFNY